MRKTRLRRSVQVVNTMPWSSAKRRRLPDDQVLKNLADFARSRGAWTAHCKSVLAAYLWPAVEIMYLCRLRGIEVITVMEDAELPNGLMTNRVKGSRDNVVAWAPRLTEAWEMGQGTAGFNLASQAHAHSDSCEGSTRLRKPDRRCSGKEQL
jgi:hypothetical protein